MINHRFRIEILGDLENNNLVADIYFDDQIVAVLTQEDGFNNMVIELYPPKNQSYWKFTLLDFEMAVQHAKKRLWDLRILPE